jgi:hypothetical protein
VEPFVNPIVVQVAGWRAAVSLNATYHAFTAHAFMRASKDALRSRSSTRGQKVIVEVYRGAGGIFPRATLGARYRPGGDKLNVTVAMIGDMYANPVGDFGSALSTPMTIGLPQEFGDAVLHGLISSRDENNTPAGDLTVDFAAYDEVNSSPYAFEHAARLLIWAFAQPESGRQIDSSALISELETW